MNIGDPHRALRYAHKRIKVRKDIPALRLLRHTTHETGARTASMRAYHQARILSPASPDVLYDLGMSQLNQGEFRCGWKNLQRRWSVTEFLTSNTPAPAPVPVWNGENLHNKCIFVTAEQGIGDEIMYASCLHDLNTLGASVIVECDPRLINLYRRSFPFALITAKPEPNQPLADLPWRDIHFTCPMATLPLYLRPDLTSFPTRPWLYADAKLTVNVGQTQKNLSAKIQRIGISWRGGAQPRDRAKRSIQLSRLLGVFSDIDTTLISLQYDLDENELKQANKRAHNKVLVAEDLNCRDNLDGLAALISSLDLIITVDNATAHLAGALGKPVWVLLPEANEWRWQDAATSHWYPTAQLFRSNKTTDWQPVLKQVRQSLKNKLDINLELNLGLSQPTLRERASQPKPISDTTSQRETILLINDTLNWYHWGCSCTSLGLYQQILKQHHAQSLPIASLHDLTIYPHNDEGTLHNTTPVALTLLYIAYIAKSALSKPVSLINHSCFPDDLAAPQSHEKLALYRKVYETLDFVAVRDSFSLAICKSMNVDATLAFDCLPLLVRDTFTHLQVLKPEKRITIGASAQTDARFIEFITYILHDPQLANEYTFDLLLGSRAYMSAEDIAFAERFADTPNTLNTIFVDSESAWLEHIARSQLLVSGRFHHTVAATCLQTPFLLFGSNTPKNAAYANRLGNYPGDLTNETSDPLKVFRDALQNPEKYQLDTAFIARLTAAAELNFTHNPVTTPSAEPVTSAA